MLLTHIQRTLWLRNVLERVPFRENSYYRHKYCPEVEAAINKQIQAEQEAALKYLNMAVSFLHPSVSRLGAGGFFMKMYHEEFQHSEEFIHYQLSRGGVPLINGLKIQTPNIKITMIEAFKQALDLEHNVTELIQDLIGIAEKAKDYHCVDFVTSIFMTDQMDSINKISHHVTEIARLCDEYGLWNYDQHLATTYPYNHKSLKKL
ncbi:hypothetical protein MSG28_001621 [Choristoneura fumiferana]|uniref:Uncharacterized protein n=1 Tax=Choristoneura fumiferana TaxID=7141 RepID=A0ACC0KUT6_CHOFU|nr:hypothetical protein MSG28_001621 [Choristoneura fumiferana]